MFHHWTTCTKEKCGIRPLGFQRVSVRIKNTTHEEVTTLFSHYIISNETELVKKNDLLILRENLCMCVQLHGRCASFKFNLLLKNKKCTQHVFFGTCVHTNHLVKRFVFSIGSIDTTGSIDIWLRGKLQLTCITKKWYIKIVL